MKTDTGVRPANGGLLLQTVSVTQHWAHEEEVVCGQLEIGDRTEEDGLSW